MTAAHDTGLTAWATQFLAEEGDPERVAQWVARTRAAIAGAVPQLEAAPDLAAVVTEAVGQHWRAFLDRIAGEAQGGAVAPFALVPAGREVAAGVAAAGLPLEVLLKVYRAAQQDVWSWATEVVGAIPPEVCSRGDALIWFWDRAGAWFDASVEASTEVYAAERARATSSGDARRLAAAQQLLALDADADGAADLDRLAAELGGYPLDGTHLALLLVAAGTDRTTGERTGQDALDRVAARARRKLAAPHALVVHPARGRAWVWLSAPADEGRLIDLGPLLLERGVLLVAGSPVSGAAGFARSHRDALAAERAVAPAEGTVPGLLLHRDVELQTLLPCTPDVDRFVARVLGPLGADDAGTRKLRDTLLAWLDEGRHADEASASLGVHRNTVRYRLGQVEDLLGHPVGRVGADLEVALRHHRLRHGG